MRVLLTLSNIQLLTAELIPQLISQFETAFSIQVTDESKVGFIYLDHQLQVARINRNFRKSEMHYPSWMTNSLGNTLALTFSILQHSSVPQSVPKIGAPQAPLTPPRSNPTFTKPYFTLCMFTLRSTLPPRPSHKISSLISLNVYVI